MLVHELSPRNIDGRIPTTNPHPQVAALQALFAHSWEWVGGFSQG